MKIKSDAWARNGTAYSLMHRPSDRLMLAFCVTLGMLVVATVLSFFLPWFAYLSIMFAPGAAIALFGGKLTRMHWAYGLNTNQRLAIERYESCDEETKKLFPKDFVETVRNAKGLGPNEDGYGSDTHLLATAAEKIVKAAEKRKKLLNVRDDKVEVALEMMGQAVEALEVDAVVRDEVYSNTKLQDRPFIKQMVGRQIVEKPNPFYREH